MNKLLPLFLLGCGLVGTVTAQQNLLQRLEVVNAASYQEGFPVSPGCWATAFGDFASVGVSDTLASALPFPTVLGSVQVFVDDRPAPMNFVGRTQVNFLVPKETAVSTGWANLRITVGGGTVYSGRVRVWPVSPGLISLNPADAAKPAAALNQDGSVNSATNRAKRGQVVSLYGVGANFRELPSNGDAAPIDRLISTNSDVKVYVSVVEASVQFSGLAPGLVNAWQLNVVIPNQPLIKGQTPVVAEVQGVKSNLVSIWVED